MVESVARAMWERSPDRSWKLLHPVMQSRLKQDARIAIAAMRKPTKAMCDEAGGFPLNELQAAALWRAMIDVALDD
jgi:hypothetical protein